MKKLVDRQTDKRTNKKTDRVNKFEKIGGETNEQTVKQKDRQSQLV